MTIREVIETVLEGEPLTDDVALQCFLAVAGAMRSAVQGEPATFEGECSAVMALIDRGLYEPTVAGLQQFMTECPNILAIEVPDDVLLRWANADGEDDPCST